MSATAEISTPARPGITGNYPVAAATLIFLGTLVALDASGNAVPASDTAGLRVIGRAEHTVDNSAGAAGDLNVDVARGVFRFANSTGNAVSADDVLKIAFVEDDQTVAITSTHKAKAGRILDLDEDGVWLDTTDTHEATAVAALTSVQNVTAAAVDLPTAEALANALQTDYNALQVDVAAIRAALVAAGIIA